MKVGSSWASGRFRRALDRIPASRSLSGGRSACHGAARDGGLRRPKTWRAAWRWASRAPSRSGAAFFEHSSVKMATTRRAPRVSATPSWSTSGVNVTPPPQTCAASTVRRGRPDSNNAAVARAGRRKAVSWPREGFGATAAVSIATVERNEERVRLARPILRAVLVLREAPAVDLRARGRGRKRTRCRRDEPWSTSRRR